MVAYKAPPLRDASTSSRRACAAFAAAALACVAWPRAAHAQAFLLPPHFDAVPLPDVYDLPVGMAFAGNGTLFLIEKTGIVHVVQRDGTAQAEPFIDLRDEVNNDHDRGMLGLTLHPEFVADGGPKSWVYLLYTVSPVFGQDWGFNQDNRYSFSRLVRYRARRTGTTITADPSSREVILGRSNVDGTVVNCIASVHNSHSNGALRFADDGSLILAIGDGAHYDFRDTGRFDAPAFDDFVNPSTGLRGPTPKAQDLGAFRSQDLSSLSGKVLRIDPETGGGFPSNPFYDGDRFSNASRIWALGLRNPYRVDLIPGTGERDPALGRPNEIIVGDVGWNHWEEINLCRTAGRNFGWPCFEGPNPQAGYQSFTTGDRGLRTCDSPTHGVMTQPLLAWHHNSVPALYPHGVYVDANGALLPGFSGNCVVGGPMYIGGSYPAEYVGRIFFADYVRGYIKTIELDDDREIVAVRDFASQTGGLADIERDPLSGDLFCLSLSSHQILRLVFSGNLAPHSLATGFPLAGPSPLSVDFEGFESADPDGDALSFEWDFGDGSPHWLAPFAQHVYERTGVYDAHLVVTDSFGASSTSTLRIAVDLHAPIVTIASPATGSTFDSPTALVLSGNATDADGGEIAYAWNVDLYHSVHVHPGVFQAPGPDATFDIAVSPEDEELLYYRVELAATDSTGLVGKSHVFVYPRIDVIDVSGTASPIARVRELTPPEPTGAGNHDIEIVRDGGRPSGSTTARVKQFDTFHAGAQGADDWIGYELVDAPPEEFRFTSLEFQEGLHFADGGWFENLRVEARIDGDWQSVSNLRVSPAYPFALASQPGFDGEPFESYSLQFDPVFADAIRLRGKPGGTSRFISCAELRAHGVRAREGATHRDITREGRILPPVRSRLLHHLAPDAPLGGIEVIQNGTFAPVGSTSRLAQYESAHGGPNAVSFGYAFASDHAFARVVFQEGIDSAAGGAFASLAVDVQQAPGGAWTPVAGVVSSPTFRGPNGVSYETYTLDFPAIVGRAIRVRGVPASAEHFVTVGEIRVLEPNAP